jgi:acyl-CoA thioesterase FadM
LYCGDRIQVFLIPTHISESEFQVNYRLCLIDGKVAATVLTKHVAIGVIDRQRTTLPSLIDAWITS